jgi:hypothetical protein
MVSKPVSGDAAEQRLKTEVMQLPPRDRRRIKGIPEVCAETTLPQNVTMVLVVALRGEEGEKAESVKIWLTNTLSSVTPTIQRQTSWKNTT